MLYSSSDSLKPLGHTNNKPCFPYDMYPKASSDSLDKLVLYWACYFLDAWCVPLELMNPHLKIRNSTILNFVLCLGFLLTSSYCSPDIKSSPSMLSRQLLLIVLVHWCCCLEYLEPFKQILLGFSLYDQFGLQALLSLYGLPF